MQLLPPERKARWGTLALLAGAFAIYYIYDQAFRNTLVSPGYYLMFLVIYGGIGTYFVLGWRQLKITKHPLPSIIFVCGFLVILLLPPPLFILPEPTPFEEEVIFSEYRSDFETVVKLAENHEITFDKTDGYGDWYIPPAGYEHLSAEEPLLIDYESDEGLIVQFHPFEWSYPIVYVERPDRIEPCRIDGEVEKQLGDNWFLCTTGLYWS